MIIELNSSMIGRNIRFLREKYNLSVKALSKLVGIRECSIRAMEKELFVPTLTEYQLNRICEVMNVTMEQLTQTELKDIAEIQFRRKDPYLMAITFLK